MGLLKTASVGKSTQTASYTAAIGGLALESICTVYSLSA